jgi:hypothetical protein
MSGLLFALNDRREKKSVVTALQIVKPLSSGQNFGGGSRRARVCR